MKGLLSVSSKLIYIFHLIFPCIIFAQALTGTVDKNKKIVVSKINTTKEYSSTIDLNDSRRQLIMAGQNYQTNYGIYASIITENSSLGTNYKVFNNVSFEIVNYKPTYFIGIDSVVLTSTKRKDGITFKIYTRALSNKKNFHLSKESLKNIHFERGSYLHSERHLNPMFAKKDAKGNVIFNENGSIAALSDNGVAFDFEFFYKDGQLVTRKEEYDKQKVSSQTYENEIASTLPGRRCRVSYNKVVF